ncbi:ParA family protein [Pseudomonas juntendi]|uniref:ParA family protein n=1 Tax=Pseudomonas TaxID=286 RepID=UPI0012ADBF3F|nr:MULTISPECIES: ParA family protein [Pseudomonas]MDG9918237.1 ParA family protein [Pseudomonas juntendi]MDH0507685.1 ParA family protein [Pseudomonas juntendi]MDH1044833.1 ParA family protein [Pseudomonas juntendi]MRT62352.1 ParA family protein [Pseudomonas sp. CAH-1]
MAKAAKRIAFINRKGGVGKTNSAITGSCELSKVGKVLLIDNDPQGNTSLILSSPEIQAQNTTASLYKRNPFITAYPATARSSLVDEERAIVENLFISTASDELEDIQANLPATAISYLTIASEKAGDEYDFIVIDCPPSAGTEQSMVLAWADYIIVPMLSDTFSIKAVDQLFQNLNEIMRFRDSVPKIGIFQNMVTYARRGKVDSARKTMSTKYPDYFLEHEVRLQDAREFDFSRGMFTPHHFEKLKGVELHCVADMRNIVNSFILGGE